MNQIFSKFSLILIITFSGVCLAGEKVNQSLLVDTTGIVFVEIPRGLVKIQGWEKQVVMIQGELDDTTKQLVFNTKNDKTLIKIDTQGQQYWGDSSVLNIFMPKQLQLHFKGIDTLFSITKLNNHIEGKSISGDLIVKSSHGKIKLSSVSGDVTLVGSSGFTKLESVSGMVNFSGNYKQAFLKSMSGDITAEVSGTDKLMIKNISGDTQISGPVKNQAELKLFSVSGDIFYKVKGALNAECEVVSQFGGEISNQLTDDFPLDVNLHKKTLSFVSGDGSGKLSMNTINGLVSIEKIINE
ncbi:DUF4097 family beta strand repeat protein [Colwellia sp. MB02u-6]|uniref:DUF4097 family beta strand repeat-containing protein n=1 Tax=Colwellia sp. MB02u-6 TaxID=2759824 RepID=UPI0015F3E45D|nr:DUF4097 family beta strand repeat-containing protein [Colwellia sp. MB02u-6]MBA6327562.1 DUF4097 family beta strand repeat protein [Colwellia sp. MB02u-6]